MGEGNTKTVTWVLIIIIAVALIAYLWYQTVPRSVPESDVVVVSNTVLDDSEEADQITDSPIYGNIPVSVSQGERGRVDPFASI